MLSTLSGTKTVILTPKRYDEHPRRFIYGSTPSRGKYPTIKQCHSPERERERRGENSYIKKNTGMLVVPLRSQNYGFGTA